MAKKNKDMQFLMKCVYWVAIGLIVLLVGYIGWQIFLTAYDGMG